MFIVEIPLDLGDLGHRDGIALGSVGKDEHGYVCEIKKVNVDLDGFVLDVARFITPGCEKYVTETLIGKYELADARNQIMKHDWDKDEL